MQYTKEQLEKLRHRWTTPKGKRLLKTIKESRCYLSPVLFREKVHNFPGINDEELEDKIDLRGAPLSGFDFRTIIEDESVDLQEKIAIISNIHFEGAILKHCNFQDGKIFDCYFENTDVTHCEFKGATLNNCNFRDSDCTGLNFRGAKLISCDFTDSVVKDLILDSTIVDEKTSFGKTLKSEKDGNYHFAS
ncbi:hypothetical protein GF354_04430, partial [Candidatus Peregrinibacteria bacterium]|nr:hypothetical protein [Candidatus Peregrinibacteria bacterium]